jgi:hypothetical protein
MAVALAGLGCASDDTTVTMPDAGAADATMDAGGSSEVDAAPLDPATACVTTGGTIGSASCCFQYGDFPDTCEVGACGCAAQYSAPTQVCQCPAGTCFGAKGPAGCVAWDGGLFPP